MNQANILTNGKIVLLLALATCALWGSVYPAVKIGFEMFAITDAPSKILFAGYRFTFAGIVLLPFLKATGVKPFSFSAGNFLSFVILGFMITTVELVFFYIGLSNTSAAKASVLGSGTFFCVLVAHFAYTDDRINRRTAAGLCLGLVGLVAVNIDRGFDLSFRFTGEGFMLLSALSFALGSVYGKTLSRTVNPALMTAWQMITGGLILVIAGLAFGGSMAAPTAASATLFAYLVLMSSVSYTLYSLLLKYNPVSRISIYNFTTPIFGTLLSGVFLGDDIFQIWHVIALGCVCTGIWLVNSNKRLG